MTALEKANFKKRLQQYAVDVIEQRIASTLQAMNNAQAAANEEEKSSAGDKYETSRAMSHIEKDMYAKQLAANKTELAALLSIDCSKINEHIVSGSIIRCTSFSFFIAAGLGKVMFEGETVFCISPNAPLAKTLLNKKAGDTILFNTKDATIIAVF